MSNRFSNTRARLAGSAAILALSAGAAMAQEGVEQVVVSSTRLQAAGFDAPTPTTVISAADLEAQAKPSVFDTLTHLPALQGSTGAAATGRHHLQRPDRPVGARPARPVARCAPWC